MRGFLVLCLAAALPAGAITVVADPTMAALNYSGATVYFPIGGGVTSAGNTSFGVGGNPGAFRQTTIVMPGPSGVSGAQAIGEFNVTSTYNPSMQGAVNTVSYSLDAMIAAMPLNQTVPSLLFGLRQGNVYFHAGFAGLGATWQTYTFNGLTQANFGSAFIIGAPQPDFSPTGGVIEFGYFFNPITFNPAGGTLQINTDNFCVVVNGTTSSCAADLAGVPEPATIGFTGLVLLGLGGIRRSRRQVVR